MRSRFIIKTATGKRIQCILKSMFEFVPRQMTKTNTPSCNKFISSMVFTIKNIWNWLDKFQDIVFKSTKASDISNDIVKIVLLDNS